jgi:hypothetical protein
MEPLREQLLKIYANIPLNLRDEITLVFKGEPLTWNVIYLEVKADTERSKEILSELSELKLI